MLPVPHDVPVTLFTFPTAAHPVSPGISSTTPSPTTTRSTSPTTDMSTIASSPSTTRFSPTLASKPKLEPVDDMHLLGFDVDLSQRTITYIPPNAPWKIPLLLVLNGYDCPDSTPEHTSSATTPTTWPRQLNERLFTLPNFTPKKGMIWPPVREPSVEKDRSHALPPAPYHLQLSPLTLLPPLITPSPCLTGVSLPPLPPIHFHSILCAGFTACCVCVHIPRNLHGIINHRWV